MIVGILEADMELLGIGIKIPERYFESSLRNIDYGEISVLRFKKKDSDVLLTVSGFTNDNKIKCSVEIFRKIKHLKASNGRIYLYPLAKRDLVMGESALLEPLHTDFLKIKNQMDFLTSYICHNIRILYPNQIFEVYEKADGIQYCIPFRVIKTNDNDDGKVIKAYNTDLTVEFDYKYILSKKVLKPEIQNPFSFYNSANGERCICYFKKSGMTNINCYKCNPPQDLEMDYED